MGGYKKILLVTDGSTATSAAEQSALNLALRDGAELVIADTIRIQGRVEKWLIRNSDQMYHLLENEKKTRLNLLAERFSGAGVKKVSAKLLVGKSSEVITREVIKDQYDLLIRYKKGVDSRQRGIFGTTALNLIRTCPCPVLLVDESHPLEHPKVLACVDIYDTPVVNDNIIHAARQIGESSSTPGLLYCWSIFGLDMMRRRMAPEDFDKMVDEIRTEHESDFKTFVTRYQIPLDGPGVAIKFGDPEYLIAPHVQDHKIDVTVMSTISPGGFASRLLGSTIESVLAELPANLLAVKPQGFLSPVKLEEETDSAQQVTGTVALIT